MGGQKNPRIAALGLITDILDKRQELDRVFDTHAAGLDPRDRKFMRMLVATTLRNLRGIDALLNAHMKRKPEPSVRQILRLGVTQMLLMQVEDHAAIGETVAIANQRQRGFVNAILRAVQRSGVTELEQPANIPEWLFKTWVQDYGPDQAAEIAHQSAQQAQLQVTWVGGHNAAYDGSIADMLQDHDYLSGQFWVQDQAASLAVLALQDALSDVSDRFIIDACAAPGGKAMQLVCAGAQVMAVDRSGKRLQRVSENFDRINRSIDIVESDLIDFKPEETPDAVLLDVPCSATGTIRRHPDLPWLKSPDDIQKLAGLQKRLLHHVAQWHCPILYATCSLQKQEGEGQIAHFLKTHAAQYELKMQRRILPNELDGGCDGFYIAMLMPKS